MLLQDMWQGDNSSGLQFDMAGSSSAGMAQHPDFLFYNNFKPKFFHGKHNNSEEDGRKKSLEASKIPISVSGINSEVIRNYSGVDMNDVKNYNGQCPLCEKMFTNRNKHQNLRDHILIHLGIKPYACPYCPYTGRQHNHIRSHIQLCHASNVPPESDASSTGSTSKSYLGVPQSIGTNKPYLGVSQTISTDKQYSTSSTNKPCLGAPQTTSTDKQYSSSSTNKPFPRALTDENPIFSPLSRISD